MITLLASSSARLLWRFGESRGLAMAAIFADAGLDPADLEKAGARYPQKSVRALWHHMAARCREPAVGLEIGRHFRPLDAQTLGIAILSSHSLLSALRRIDRFERLLNTEQDHTVLETPTRVDFLFGLAPPDPALQRLLEDARMASLLSACRYGIGGELDPVEVALTYPEPDETAVYYGFYRCPLEFGAARARLSFSLQDAARPMTTANRELALRSDHLLQRALLRLGTDDVIGQARRAIVGTLPSGAPRAEDLAVALCMSSRTLQRKLAEHGTSYTALLSDVRRELAVQYVRDPGTPMHEISFLLGFSELSAFVRAFRRWTGLPPGEFRKRQA